MDGEGLPTSDPIQYPLAGALMPMAGHKGYGIAFLVEVLTGVLGGGAFGNLVRSWVVGPALPVNQSHSFIAINVEAFEPAAEFKQRMDALIRQIKDAAKAKGSARIWLPGEKEWEYRAESLAKGIDLPADVRAEPSRAGGRPGLERYPWRAKRNSPNAASGRNPESPCISLSRVWCTAK